MAATSALEASARNLPTLTGLRWVAAFAVFLDHAARFRSPEHRAGLEWLTGAGYVGVSFFFVLSGFVLMWSRKPGDTAAGFYRRRFARVYPSHAVVWVLVALLGIALGNWNGLRRFGVGALLLQAWVPDQTFFYAVNGVAWSLSAEAFFYATFPLYAGPLARAGRRVRLGLGAAALLCIVAVAAVASQHIPHAQLIAEQRSGGWLWLIYNCPAVRVAEFVIGAVLALEVRDGLRLPRWALPAALAVSAVAYMVAGIQPSAYGRVALTIIPFAIVILAGASRDLQGQATTFARPTWVRLGQWSFAFYVIHANVTTLLRRWWMFDDVLPWLAGCAVALAISLALSACLFHLVEHPMERRLRGRRRDAVILREPTEQRASG